MVLQVMFKHKIEGVVPDIYVDAARRRFAAVDLIDRHNTKLRPLYLWMTDGQ